MGFPSPQAQYIRAAHQGQLFRAHSETRRATFGKSEREADREGDKPIVIPETEAGGPFHMILWQSRKKKCDWPERSRRLLGNAERPA